jgi:adenosine/AMP kinase
MLSTWASQKLYEERRKNSAEIVTSIGSESLHVFPIMLCNCHFNIKVMNTVRRLVSHSSVFRT